MSTYGSFDIKGIEELEKAITEKYSGAKSTRIINKALSEGAQVFSRELEQNVEKFKDKGYEQEEIVVSRPRKTVEGRIVKVGWNGPHKRHSIVHLNEFGYNRMGQQYTPRGYGVIDKTVRGTEQQYLQRMAQEMREML